MKKFGIGAGALVLSMSVGLASSADAASVLDVTWSGENQTLTTLEGAGSGADFYDYHTGTFNGIMKDDLQLATAYAFVHESTTTGALSFGMVFTGSNVATPRQTCRDQADRHLCRTTFEGTLSGADDDSVVSVKDDGVNIFGDTDRSAAGANGFYSLYPFTGTTDGFVVDGVLSMGELLMDETTFDNFENLIFVSGTEDNLVLTNFTLNASNADLRIQIAPVVALAPVPLPAGAVLLLSGLALAGGLGARKRKQG